MARRQRIVVAFVVAFVVAVGEGGPPAAAQEVTTPAPEGPAGADADADADPGPGPDGAEESGEVISPLALLEEASLEARALYESCVDGVVFIQARASLGAGFYVRDGLAVTNYHVIADGLPLEVVHHDGISSPAEVVAVDRSADLALLRVQKPSPRARPLELASDATPGQLVMVVGHPYAAEPGYDDGVTTTWSWSLGRVTTTTQEWLQTDAQAYPGNSGGPVIDRDGRVLGIVTLGVGGASSLVFAVRSEWIEELIEQPPTGYEPSVELSLGLAWRWWDPGERGGLGGWETFLRLDVDAWWAELGVSGLERDEGLVEAEAVSRTVGLQLGRRVIGDGWFGLDVGIGAGVALSFDDVVPHRFEVSSGPCDGPCEVQIVRMAPQERVGLLLPAEVRLAQEPLFVALGGHVDALDRFAVRWSARVGVVF